MKSILLAVLFILLIPLNASFPQDNIGGDYLMSGTQKLISLDLEGAKLIDTLKMLSQQTGLNFVSTEAVKERTLTLYLEKVPLKEAMDIIFKANNLSYEYYPDANMFVVKEMGKPTIELKSKVYHLKYVRIRSTRQQKEINTIMEPLPPVGPSGQTTAVNSSGSSNSSSSDSNSDTETAEDRKEIGIKNAIKRILTDFGKISEDPITNSLIVVDVPSQFAIIDEVIASLDIPVPKVMIEVELLDVTKGLIDQIGFKYGRDTSFNNDFLASYNGPLKQVAFPFRSFPGTAARSFTYGTFDEGTFNMLIQALSTDTSTKVLARPKILTLSNETAEINLTTLEAIGVNTTTTETGVQTSTTERAETGTKLRVTPQVTRETGEITLFLEVFTKDATDSELTLTGDVTGTIKNPEERGAKTVLRLANGETLLLGGLIRNKSIKTISKVPLLGDIPFIGNAFRFKDDNRSERELLVFMTPKIIDDTPVVSASGRTLSREVGYSRREVMSLAMDKYSR
ncbi:MAG: secretin N-terminal domain-containing protein [Candidatus Omnitrophota bacterium]